VREDIGFAKLLELYQDGTQVAPGWHGQIIKEILIKETL
jgi:hypothetical protein